MYRQHQQYRHVFTVNNLIITQVEFYRWDTKSSNGMKYQWTIIYSITKATITLDFQEAPKTCKGAHFIPGVCSRGVRL